MRDTSVLLPPANCCPIFAVWTTQDRRLSQIVESKKQLRMDRKVTAAAGAVLRCAMLCAVFCAALYCVCALGVQCVLCVLCVLCCAAWSVSISESESSRHATRSVPTAVFTLATLTVIANGRLLVADGSLHE